jgi:hypothetical protein
VHAIDKHEKKEKIIVVKTFKVNISRK